MLSALVGDSYVGVAVLLKSATARKMEIRPPEPVAAAGEGAVSIAQQNANRVVVGIRDRQIQNGRRY